MTGVGGTGVVTIGALLGMAAHLEGKGCSVLDMTGLSQKGGAVLSHIRIAARPEELHAVRIAAGEADSLIGCDLVVAASAEAVSRLRGGLTRAVVNSFETTIGDFTRNPDLRIPDAELRGAIVEAAGADATDFVDATGLATALMGDSIATNLFMLGYAWQKGLVPVSREAIERAIELNEVAIESNKRSFSWGRVAAVDPAAVERAARPSAPIALRTAVADAGRDRRPARRVPHRLPERRLCEALFRPGRQGPVSGSGARRRPERPRRGGRALCLQADGLQGRVRGRAPLHRRHVPQRASAASSTATTRSNSTWRRR